MNLGIACLVALLVGLGLILRQFSKRHAPALATENDLDRLRGRVQRVKKDAQSIPAIHALVQVSEHFIQRAQTSIEFQQLMRARLHINLVAMVLSWAETVVAKRDVDTPRMTTTNQLGVALALLKENKYDLAIEELNKVWLDQYAHLTAKRVAVMGRVWISATRGDHQSAAEDEQLLLMLPAVAAMEDVDITMTLSKDGE